MDSTKICSAMPTATVQENIPKNQFNFSAVGFDFFKFVAPKWPQYVTIIETMFQNRIEFWNFAQGISLAWVINFTCWTTLWVLQYDLLFFELKQSSLKQISN